jgi:hypothetical protein
LLAILLLATALAPLRAARAQLEDPGFGDPTTLTAPRTAGGFGNLPATTPNLPNVYAPSGPLPPVMAVRPNSWPGGPAPAPAAPQQPLVATSLTTAIGAVKKSPADPPYDPAEMMARIGTERIQACEVLPMINRAINGVVAENPDFSKLKPEDQQAEIHRAQKSYMKAAIQEIVGTKLLVSELRSSADAKMIEENEKHIREYFNSDHLPRLCKEYNASSVIDLEDKLRALGGSIDSQRTLFIEQSLAGGWLNQQVKKEDRDPTHDEMLTYYQAHVTDWETPARARWEQITAKWSNFNTREEAKAAIARWGNDVYVRRVPFAEVAKAHSQDFAAGDGGRHDWAAKGSLRSEPVDAALFALPVGALSRIIEDDEGCHIVRVLEREEAKRRPFVEVQQEIRKQLHDGGQAERRKKYIEELRARIPVWTVFDDEALPATGATWTR